MKKKPNVLLAALDGLDAPEQDNPQPAATPDPENPPKQPEKASRKGRVLIGGHFDPNIAKQLRIIAAEDGTTNQALLEEALNLLFLKKGKTAIL